MRIRIENLKAKMRGVELTLHQKADALTEFNNLLDYVEKLELSNSARSDSYNEVVPQTDLLAEKLTNQLFVMDKQKILKEKYNELKKILSKNEIDKDYKELLLLYADITMQSNDLSGRLAKILIEKNML